MAESGKLWIRAYKEPDYSPPVVATFEAYVNPAEITIAYELEWNNKQGAGSTGSRMDFTKAKPGDLALTLFLDGTGANGNRQDVRAMLRQFYKVTGYNGGIHRPNYLVVAWGKVDVKRCVLKSAAITYKLFSSDGVPLRAVIAANFADNSDDKTRLAWAQDSSPDLSHVRLVQAGDTLPKLCYEIYGDPRRYLEVARFNELPQFRNLVPGTTLLFPALAK